MTWLGTNSGKRIDLLDPDPTAISLEDIARGLAFVPRFMGQTHSFYSVLTHSVNVASLVPKEFRLAALLHDATEAYIGDLPTPLKDLLGEKYRVVERGLANAIREALECPYSLSELPKVVKDADRLMLITEHHLLQETPADWGWDREEIRLDKLPHVHVSQKDFIKMVREAM